MFNGKYVTKTDNIFLHCVGTRKAASNTVDFTHCKKVQSLFGLLGVSQRCMHWKMWQMGASRGLPKKFS